MAERESAESGDEGASAPEGDRPRGRSRSIGRGLATGLVVAFLAYLIGSGVVSVVPQIFWPRVDAPPPNVRCEEGLSQLRAELLARAGDHVSEGGTAEDLRPWLRDWDRRHLALEDRCGDTHARTWDLLGRMRQRLASTLRRFDDGEGDLDRDLLRALEGASNQHRSVVGGLCPPAGPCPPEGRGRPRPETERIASARSVATNLRDSRRP